MLKKVKKIKAMKITTNNVKLMYISFFLIFLLGLTLAAQLSHNSPNKNPQEDVFCSKIDTLVINRYKWKESGAINVNINKIIGLLEAKSKIYANCEQRGFGGCIYFSDSIFDSDIKKWRAYFKCSN